MESVLMGVPLPVLVARYDQINWSSSGPKDVWSEETEMGWQRSHEMGSLFT